ncbi:hypothetical protein RR11_2552 [Ruegeria sp. R11]|nr:hypothetical protein RR11_2552 [Ruegeria sp. R11]
MSFAFIFWTAVLFGSGCIPGDVAEDPAILRVLIFHCFPETCDGFDRAVDVAASLQA